MRPARSERPHWSVMGVVVAALLGVSCGSATDSAPVPVPTGTPDRSLELVGTDNLSFTPETTTALPGRIEVTLTSGPAVRHNVVFEDVDAESVVADAPPGGTDTGEVELDTGTYTYFCAIPGHRAAGMEGTLVVAE